MKQTPVTSEEEGIRLDRWFARHFPAVTQGQLQKALRSKLVRVDGKRAEANQRLEVGQIIKHPEFAETLEKPKQILSKEKIAWVRSLVLYQDEFIIAINKPAGLATQGGSGVSEHIDGLLPALQGEMLKQPKLVHRLDKDTSGVLLLARDAKTADILMKLFASKQTEKTYWALVAGVPTPHEGVIDAPLVKQVDGWMERMVVDKNHEEAKRSTTEYRVIDHLAQRLSWVELKPLTGRTHQLRVHMEYLGHPIIGDGKYGGDRSFPEGLNLPKQLHLHARHILIPDFKGKTIQITAPLPPHMKESWNMLGLEEGKKR